METRTANGKSKIKRIAAIYLSVFLAAILLISLFINMSSFQQQYIGNKLSFYSVSAGRVVDKVETGLLYGKSLDRYFGLKTILKDWSSDDASIVDIKVLSPDQKQIYCQTANPSKYKGRSVDDSILLEIRDSEQKLCGYLNVVIDLEESLALLAQIRWSFVGGAAILLFLGVAAIYLFVKRSPFIGEDLRIEKKKVLTFILILVTAAQILFSVYSFIGLKSVYLETCTQTGEAIQALVQSDIDRVLSNGVKLDQIYGFEDYASDIVSQAKVMESVTLDGTTAVVTLSDSYIRHGIWRIVIDMLTILVTSVFVAAEIVNFLILSVNKRTEKISGVRHYDKLLAVRTASFFIHVACYLPVSFIPIMMYRLTGGSASDFVLGLPIMILFATGVVFTLLSAGFSRKIGWKRLLLIGVALVIGSSLLAGLIPNAAVLVIARGLYGAAYAIVYVAIREFAALSADRQERSNGLSQVTAGLYAGINIGAVLGAMIYDSVGFLGVFLISAVVGGIGFSIVFFHCHATKADIQQTEEETKALVGVGQIIKNWDMMRLVIFIIAPLAISSLFFEYFLPVYAVKESVSSADIGRAFLINGIAIAYVAPWIVKKLSGKLSDKVSLFFYTVWMACGFFAFGAGTGVSAILIASAIMGIAEGAALVSQNMIMLDLPIAKKAGTSRILSVYATARKLSQTAGPQIFAAFMVLGNQQGMMAFGVMTIVFSMTYIWSGWVDRGMRTSHDH